MLGVTGALIALGHGETPGEGSCEAYYIIDEVEVAAGTPGAVRRVRGGTGDLQLRLADGRTVWCSSHHCRPWQPPDDNAIGPDAQPASPAPPPADDDAAPPPPPPPPLPPPPPSPPPPPLSPSSAVPAEPQRAEQCAPIEGAFCARPHPTARLHLSRHSPALSDAGESLIGEQAALEAARLARRTKHERARALLKSLTATRFKGKQIRLADALQVSNPWLSNYMNEKNSKGSTLDRREQLNDRLSTIIHALRRAGLPTELPSADEMAAAAAAAATADAAATTDAATAVQSKRAKPSADNPVFTAPAPTPKAAVLTVNLADVEGWQEGGMCHVMALGVPVLGDGRWEMPCPGNADDKVLRLRVGLRGRRTMSARCRASIAGRTFEWWIEVMDCRHEISMHGGPLWVAREVNSTSIESLGQRIIGRAPLAR